MTSNTAVGNHLLLTDTDSEAILPATETGAARASSFPLDWRQMLGGVLLVAGALAVFAGVIGATGATTMGDQLSYIASGGLGGAGLIALGVMLVVMHEHVQDRAALADLTSHMASLQAGMAELLDGTRRK
jgi:hypothetical protein